MESNKDTIKRHHNDLAATNDTLQWEMLQLSEIKRMTATEKTQWNEQQEKDRIIIENMTQNLIANWFGWLKETITMIVDQILTVIK